MDDEIESMVFLDGYDETSNSFGKDEVFDFATQSWIDDFFITFFERLYVLYKAGTESSGKVVSLFR